MTSSQNISAAPRPFFSALDGFRGLLALLVAVHHTQWFSYLNYKSFVNEGFVLIDLFFVFSGFLLYTLYGRKLKTGGDVADFIKRRICRLYPIHIFMLFVFLGFNLLRLWVGGEPAAGETLAFGAGAPDNWTTFISHIFLTHSMGIHDSLSFNWPSWTISVEFYVYFIFAAVILFLRPNKAWHMALIATAIALIYYGLLQVVSKITDAPKMDITYNYGFWRCIGGFFTGVIGAWLFKRFYHLKDTVSQAAWSLLELVALFAYLSFTIWFIGKSQFFIAPFALLFVFVFAFDGGIISRIMSHRVFGYLAKISYSVYMVHAIIAVVFDKIGSKLLKGFVQPYNVEQGLWGDLYLIPYLIVVIIISHFTWRFVEGYGGRWLSRVLKVRTRAQPKTEVKAA